MNKPDTTLNLYNAAQVRELDRIAINEHGIPGIDLMQRAGEAAFEILRQRWPQARRIGVFCGTGNNGGDGYVLARLAKLAGLSVRVWQLGDVTRIHGDALTARNQMLATAVEPVLFEGGNIELADREVLVDALLGTGLSSEIEGVWKTALESINAAHARGTAVLALDIPSGLNADNGQPLGLAVEADCTVTFIANKPGLMTAAGPAYAGEVVLDDLDLPRSVYHGIEPVARRISYPDTRTAIPARRADAHKGSFGHVLLVGGDVGMAGAIRLAAEAAARVGAGLISAATHPQHAAQLCAQRPELMCHPVANAHDLHGLLQRATVVAIGPGLGQSEWGKNLLERLLETSLPLVIDADALNLLALEPCNRPNWILTPHPGEAARLLNCSVQQVEDNRLSAAQQLQENYGGVVVLKGAGTIVRDADDCPGLCDAGNPGMASGGMGDILTGMIAGLLAQGLSPGEAARLAVYLHGTAADEAAKDGQRGLLASDLLPIVRRLVG